MPSPHLTRSLTAVALVCLSQGATSAEPIYRSIDANGNVTYSSSPPPDSGAERVEQVPIAPGPSAAQQRSAEQRALEIERDSSSQAAPAPRARGPVAGVAQAEQDLARARANLEQARVQRDDDWQWLASGGRVLSERYFNRVSAAEAEVQAAEDALRQARRGR
jgi:hypothetical protein